jgi:signal transduction histidine kinase
MTLRFKFVVALVLLALTLGVNVASTVWGLRFLDRELAWPLRSVQAVMSRLHEIKRAGERQSDLLLADGGLGHAGPEFAQEQAAALAALAELDALPTAAVRSGISSTRNLRERTERIGELGTLAGAAGFEELSRALRERHELIERIEGRILADARLAVDHARRLETLIQVVVAVSVVGAVAIAALITLLVRRWVLLPIERLREGAERLGRGEFDHRIALGTGDELGRLADEFDEMAAMIKAMQDERVERERLAAIGEMSRRVVHNLRTPLSGIRALAETTKGELDLGSDLRDVQDRIIASVDRFEGWLQGLLRASSPIVLHPRPLDPAALARGVVEHHADAAGARGIGLRFEPGDLPASVRGDPHHLEHALTALVSNALDFGPAGSEVVVCGGRDGGYWTLTVTDSGPGVPAELQASVFRPYFTTRPGGTGIGLAMVKQVAERHGGTVVLRCPAHDAPEARGSPGTAFTIRLPVDAGVG